MMEDGYKVNGRYKIMRPLGEGGMANVYLAYDLILNREVAVKVLRLDLRNDPDTVRRFQREALATTELVHPNIVSIYDVGMDNGLHYIVMEYVKGTDLKKYIVEHFPIAYQRVIDIMQQILSAVAHAHKHNIIHRDLKPQNILVDEQGNIKITDFGIAVALSENSITQTNSLLGSVHYLSPEQARGSMATKQSDIYALGIILYEMLTGSVPFEGESAVSIALKHFQDEMPSVRAFDPRIPQALENVVLKATAKDPSQRYLDVAAMSADIATSLSPDRAHEPKLELEDNHDATKVMPIVGDAVATKEATAEKIVDQTEQEQAKQPKKKGAHRKRNIIIAVIVAIVALLTTGVILAVIGNSEIAVPDLSDMNEVQATAALKDADLQLGAVTKETSDSVASGRVIRSTPSKGSKVKSQAKVAIVLSTGKKTYKLKNYKDAFYSDIKSDLEKLGFKVQKKNKSSDSVTKGVIMSQDIPAGKKVVPADTTITLTVSSGPATFALRDLSNYTQTSVTDYANENGLDLKITEANSETVTAGMVISQTPVANTMVKKGDRLSVIISKGPTEKPKADVTFNKVISIPYKAKTNANSSSASSSSSTETSSQAESGVSENKVNIFIEDKSHNFGTVYKQLTIKADTSVTLTFTVVSGGTARYKVVRDGEIIQAEDNITQ